MPDPVTISIEADTSGFQAALENLQSLSAGLGAQLTNGLKAAAISGKDLDDILRQVGMNLAGMALNKGLAPLTGMFNQMLSGLMGGIMPFANGGVVTPFASGGVVSAPSFFPMSGGLGLMGEAGPEAIMPLQRGSDGRLGVAGGGGSSVNVVFNVTASDAGSFRKSEAQITGMLARAVQRGSRTM